MNKRQKWFLALYAVFFVMMAISLLKSDGAQKLISKLITGKYPEQYYVHLEVISNIDTRSHVIMKCYIPCRNKAHKGRLRREIPRIKNDILEHMSEKMAAMIKERKFEDLKLQLLDIINQYSDSPVKNLYFDRLVIA